MARLALRDNLGRLLGYYIENKTKITLVDSIGRELGHYRKRTNETWRSYPTAFVGKGNLLASLLNVDL